MKKIFCALFGAAIMAAFLLAVNIPATERLVGVIQSFQGLSTDSKTTTGIITGSTWKETDTGRRYIFNGSAWVVDAVVAGTDSVRMTATGVSAAVCPRGYQHLTWYFDIYNINTSVTIGLQVKKGTTPWRYAEAAIAYTANGNYGLTYLYAATADSMRLNWSAEAGGTAAIVTHNVGLSGE